MSTDERLDCIVLDMKFRQASHSACAALGKAMEALADAYVVARAVGAMSPLAGNAAHLASDVALAAKKISTAAGIIALTITENDDQCLSTDSLDRASQQLVDAEGECKTVMETAKESSNELRGSKVVYSLRQARKLVTSLTRVLLSRTSMRFYKTPVRDSHARKILVVASSLATIAGNLNRPV